MSTTPEEMVAPSLQSREIDWRVYLEITRPKVMALVLVTALPVLAMESSGGLDWVKAFWVLFGTALAGAASSALNAYVERESDARMARTRNRAIPASVLLPQVVLAYGVTLTVVSTLLLWAVGGTLAALVGLSTIIFYVAVYTLWLKPRTPQNIVIGGAAGATAPLIASAAMDGSISVGAWLLFGIIFLWTPPHFWAIAIFRKREYANAGFPMMPVVVGDQPTRWRSLAYTLALIPFSLLPYWFGYFGLLYVVGATLLGLWFLGAVVQSLVAQNPSTDWKVFKTSSAYLLFLFLLMFIDLAGSNL